MSTTPISNLLKLVAPAPTARGEASVGAKEFDRYLHKAALPVALAEKPAPKRESEVSQSEPAPKSKNVESSDQQQAASSEDQRHSKNTSDEQPVATGEKVQTSEDPDDDQDEVVLSEEAVASTVVQSEEPAAQETKVDSEVAISTSADDVNNSKQAKSQETLKLASDGDANSKGQQAKEGSDLQKSNAEKSEEVQEKSQQSKLPLSKAQIAEQSQESSDQKDDGSETPREQKTTANGKKGSRLQDESGEQTGLLQETRPSGEKTKSEVGTIAQSLTPVVSDSVDSTAATVNSNSSTPTAELSSTSSPVADVVPSAIKHHTETSNTSRGSETSVPTVDRGRFVHRVANAFRSAQQNDGEIQLRLSPPELGSLKIEIAVRHGVLTAKLEAETVDARHTLLDNLPALRHRLAEQDIRIDKFEVDIRRDGGQGQSGTEDRQSRNGAHRGDLPPRSQIKTEPEVITSRMPRSAMNLTPDSLDVRI